MSIEVILREIPRLSVEERKRLIYALVDSLEAAPMPDAHGLSLMELEGLGADIWQGIDAQAYVQQLRSEWDHRP